MTDTTVSKTDRIFSLTPRPGVKTTDAQGLVDPRLFKGENKLHAVMDSGSCHWFLKYEQGGIPEPLRGRFTNFKKATEAAKTYFDSRGVDISEVINDA